MNSRPAGASDDDQPAAPTTSQPGPHSQPEGADEWELQEADLADLVAVGDESDDEESWAAESAQLAEEMSRLRAMEAAVRKVNKVRTLVGEETRLRSARLKW